MSSEQIKTNKEETGCCEPTTAISHQSKTISRTNEDHDKERGIKKEWLAGIISLLLLLVGLALDHLVSPSWFSGPTRFWWYAIAYLPVGLPVLLKGLRYAFRGEVFTEFILMSIATIGAFYIGDYPEGVAVMVFYAIGELFQSAAA
jgi:Zn2+/Cd2+-exporting ATPase